MSKKAKNLERSFGISVGIALLLIAAAVWWRGRTAQSEAFALIGAFLLFFGLVRPQLLKYPSAAWWKFAAALGYVNSRILLTLLFSVLLVPIAMLWRLLGKDPLNRRRDQFEGWTAYPTRYRDRNHFERMF